MHEANHYITQHGTVNRNSYIALDEITNFASFEMLERLRACARSKVPWVRPVIRCTGNPGGRLHNEVKRYFVDPAPKGCRIITNESGKTRVFVPANITDNPILMNANPGYMNFLKSITNPALRKAWLEGCWDVAIGSFFGDVWDREKHVIGYVPGSHIPKHWEIYHSFDWGSAKPYACLWWTVAANDIEIKGRTYPQGAILVLHELYGASKDLNDTGLGENSRITAGKILNVERQMFPNHRVQPGPADPALWQIKDGPSTAESMGAEGVHFTKADNSRIPGWDQVRMRLVGNMDTGPMLYISEQCANLIRTLPVLTRDEHHWEDLESESEDHLADCLRYLVMARKMPPLTASQLRILEERKKQIREPLDKRFGGPSMLVNEDDRGRQRFVEKNNG